MIDHGVYQVLLVEDNEIDARSISKALTSQAECEIERVGDLRSALASVDRRVFDCVLLDLSLPDSDGLISVETMVARSPYCPVVVLTGLDDPELAVEAVARGAQDYLVKNTITAELVCRAIRYAVTRHSSEAELRDVQERLADLSSREQIARDLHDTVIQRLFATGMSLQAASSLTSIEQIRDRTTAAVDQIDDAIRELRQAIFGLHSVDQHESLAYDVSQLVDSCADTLGLTPVVRFGDVPIVDAELHQDVLAVIREALSNVARHADAPAVTVSVFVEGPNLVVRVTDNGDSSGENVTGTGDMDRDRTLSGHGLVNMRSRAEAHQGTMGFDSGAAGGELYWSVPIGQSVSSPR